MTLQVPSNGWFVSLAVALAACSNRSDSEPRPEFSSEDSPSSHAATDDAPDGKDGDGLDPSESTESDPDPEDHGCPAQQAFIEGVLDDECGACHGPRADPVVVPGFSYVNEIEVLVGSGKIVMGDSQNSQLFQLIADGAMPPNEAPLSLEFVERLETFIDTCEFCPESRSRIFASKCSSPQPPLSDPNPLLEEADVIAAMLDDLLLVEPDDRPFTRYLSCAHLSNQGYPPELLFDYQEALNKLVNSTSLETDVQAIVPIDGTYDTVFRIDLTNYGYDQPVVADAFDKVVGSESVAFELQTVEFDDKWQLMTRGSAYGYTPNLSDANAFDLVEGTEDFIPFLSCDAFIEIVARTDDSPFSSGVYYDLIESPAALRGRGVGDSLEEHLGFSFAEELAAGTVERAGVSTSIVTRDDMLAQWLEAGSGRDVWLRCDFDGDDTPEENPRNNPIDILDACDRQAIMYGLPNGLFAYFIAGENGQRLDSIEGAIFGDPRLIRENGDNVPPLSCMGCHSSQILRPIGDEIRALYADGSGNATIPEDVVLALYPSQEAFMNRIDESTARFMAAFVPIGGFNQDTVQSACLDFRGDVDVLRGSSELGLSDDALDFDDLPAELAPWRQDTSVTRDTWERLFLVSACRVGLADPGFCEGTFAGVDDVANDEQRFHELLGAAF